MEPAASIIRLLGGPTAIARGIGVHRTRVSNWPRPRTKGGTDGHIPQKHHTAILHLAKNAGIELRPEHLIVGVPTPPTLPDASASRHSNSAEALP